jgi:hypothetical protein
MLGSGAMSVAPYGSFKNTWLKQAKAMVIIYNQQQVKITCDVTLPLISTSDLAKGASVLLDQHEPYTVNGVQH